MAPGETTCVTHHRLGPNPLCHYIAISLVHRSYRLHKNIHLCEVTLDLIPDAWHLHEEAGALIVELLSDHNLSHSRPDGGPDD